MTFTQPRNWRGHTSFWLRQPQPQIRLHRRHPVPKMNTVSPKGTTNPPPIKPDHDKSDGGPPVTTNEALSSMATVSAG